MTTAAAAPHMSAGPRRRGSRVVGAGEVATWFASVVCAYWLYWLIVVPLIEPGVDPETVTRASDADIRAAHEAPSARKQALARYFPPGSWELDNPAVWETDQTLLLFKTPRPTPDGQVELRHCTLLFFPRSRDEADVSKVRPIIMRPTEGATLKFDAPIVLKTVDLGKRQLIGGRLKGLITIERDSSRPGASDGLLITTRDVELADDRAYSQHPVNFRLGRSHGSGRDMEILLADDDGRPGGGFRTGKVRTLLLKRDVVMHLALDDGPLAGGNAAIKKPDTLESTLKITCQGAFQYDFAHYAASFNDQVDVVRMSTGPSDLLNCEVLTVSFEQGGAKRPTGEQAAAPVDRPAASNQARDLPVQKIEARGDPVTLRSPSRGIYIQCRRLDYLPAPGGAIGRLAALGPGVLQASAPMNPEGKYRIGWTREFRFEPAEGGQHVASLHGGATVGVANLGEITAHDRLDAEGRVIEQGQIFAWLTPIKKPPAADQVAVIRPVAMQVAPSVPGSGGDDWQLERVRAEGNVVINMPQLEGATEKLEAWIERPQPTVAGPPRPGQPGADAQPPARSPQARPRANPTQRFSVSAGGVQAKLVPDGQQYAVAAVTLEGQAHLEELTPRPGVKPMIVDGDRLHVAGADTLQTRVTVAGKLAHVEAGGLVLLGETIELEKHTNRLWVDGPGRMIMPMEQDLNGRPLARPQPVEIAWQGGMNFQTNTVVYQRNVRVTSQHQSLATEKLEAMLTRPIDFNNPGPAPAPGRPANPGDEAQLASVRCHGEAFLDSREFDPQGQRTSFDQMQVFDLSIDQISGAIEARGPGWVRHVARETGERWRARPGIPGQPRPQPKPDAPRMGLTYLHVQFQRSITGNLHQRKITFGEPTKTVYAPVADWDAKLDAEDPASLGPEGMVLDAKQLTVLEMPARDKTKRGWFELVAQGNVLAEGAQFVALGHRATYSEDKDQLVLEGDGRSPAEISYAAIAGGKRREAKADIIKYAIPLQHVIFSGAQSLNVDVLQPQGKPDLKK